MEREEAINLWFVITYFVVEIRKYTAALCAIEKCEEDISSQDKENAYFKLSREAIEHLLITEIAKLFDNAKTCGKDNCSLKKLRELCLKGENKAIFLNNSDNIIEMFDVIFEEYENVISKKIRNEKIAHHDLKALYSFTEDCIFFKEEELVEKTSDLVIKVGEQLLAPGYIFTPLEELIKTYEIGIKTLNDKACGNNV